MTAGEVIYKAFAPTLKMVFTIAGGFLITKMGMFPPQCAKGVSIISLNVSLPALVFYSMVSAFTPENVKAFGSIAIVAVLYMSLGGTLAWVVTEFFYVPKDFQWGILVMGVCSNWGNLPIATVQTMATQSPFDPTTDVQLGTAYISIFVLFMNTSFFPLGLHKLCALDFNEENLSRERLPFKRRWAKRLASLRRREEEQEAAYDLAEQPRISSPSDHDETEEPGELAGVKSRKFNGGVAFGRMTSRASSFHSMMEQTRPIPATAPLDAINTTRGQVYHQPITPVSSKHEARWPSKLINLLKGLVTPVSCAIVIAIPCALVSPLKALFVVTPDWSGTRVPYAPDGRPPLAFITETAQFAGAITVPASLMLLGASFARLKVPSKWRELPLTAIVAMTVVKMVVLPVFGIFVVQGLRDSTSLFPRQEHIRTFVAILCSGTPAAINQLVVTQLYNPAGTADTLASFLMLQYAVMPVLSTALAAIALYIAEQ